MDPLQGKHASQTSLGLTICRVVTDLTSNIAFPPVQDSRYLSATLQGSDGASTSHPLVFPQRKPKRMITASGWDCMEFRNLLRGGEVWDLTPFQPAFADLP